MTTQRLTDIPHPLCFDEWRSKYDQLFCTHQVEYYSRLYAYYPRQDHCTLTEAIAFGRQLKPGVRVLEMGGWDGRVANVLLNEFPQIAHWLNVEVCRPAVEQGLTNPRYSAQVPDEFLWNWPSLPAADVFFAAHVLEHLKVREIEQLIGRLDGITEVYVEAPIPDAGRSVSWSGDISTHVLEIGWQELEGLFERFGYRGTYRTPHIRWFSR
jgi:hypothetical protein